MSGTMKYDDFNPHVDLSRHQQEAAMPQSTDFSVLPAPAAASSRRRTSSCSPTSDDTGNSFKFTTTTRPEEFKDPELMRTVRSHVMFGVVEGRQRVPPRAKKSAAAPATGSSTRGENSSTVTTAQKRIPTLRRSDSSADANPDNPQFIGREEALDIFQRYRVPRSSTSLLGSPSDSDQDISFDIPALPKHTVARGKLPVWARYDRSRRIGADELLGDSTIKAKDVIEKSEIVGQVDTSDHASKIGHEGSLLTNSPANLRSEVSVPNILPIYASTSIDPKKRDVGELPDIPFPEDSPVRDRGIEIIHSEQNDASISQESHPGEALNQVHTQNMDEVHHFAYDSDTHAELDKRHPMEFNHTISYFNKIKNRFATQPGIYKQFLEILQAYQRDSMPITDVHAQMTQLFDSAPDLLKEFEQFVPETVDECLELHKELVKLRRQCEERLIKLRKEHIHIGAEKNNNMQSAKAYPKMEEELEIDMEAKRKSVEKFVLDYTKLKETVAKLRRDNTQILKICEAPAIKFQILLSLAQKQSEQKTADLQASHVDESVEFIELRKPAFEYDAESLTPGSLSDKGFSHTAETYDSSNEVKKHIVESLMQKVYDLLGHRPSGVSESSSSPESNSDEDVKESIHLSTASPGEGSTAVKPNSSLADAGTSSQVPSQSKRTNTGARNSESTRSLPAAKLTGKRKQCTGDEPAGEDEEQGNSGSGNPRPLKSRRHEPRFACPFYKRRPEIHGRNASCLWPGFNTISRLKEHLYRVHLSNVDGSNICPRCRETFESSSSLVRHLARTERCVQVVVPEQEDGLDEDQVLRLRSRDRGTEPEDKWRHIYRICHRLPEDAETPWPYCDQESPANQAVEGYDWYQRQHLPNLIREHLEREPEIRVFVERFGDRLPAIIRECQMNLHRRFTSPRTAVDPANEPGLAVDSDQPTVQPPNRRADQHPVPPPVAFEAPPNTDNGMTSSEAQQVHAMSSQKNRNSDSGYGSAVLEPHQPVELREHGHSDPGLFSSGDAPLPGIFPDEPRHLQGSHHLQDPSIVDVIQSSSVQSTEEGALLGEAGRHQIPEWVNDFSSATIDGQQMVAQNQNSANNPDDGIWGVAIDWPELDGDDSIDWPKLDGNDFTFGN